MMLDKEIIFKNLPVSVKEVLSRDRIHVFESVVSTNTLMKEYAEAGSDEWEIIISSSQSGGRGRVGRSFFSPMSSGLYLSLLLRPNLSPMKANLITTCTAVAACIAIEKTLGTIPEIKWVNDIYVDSKKVAGILTEGAVDMETGMLKYAVMGIGINVYAPDGGFPSDIESVAASLVSYQNDGGGLREAVAAQFIAAFWELYPNIEGCNTVYREYKKRMFLTGCRVDVISHCGSVKKAATVMSVEPDFTLRVRYDDMEEELLYDGEVSLRIR